MESVPKSAFDIKTLINSENVEGKFYETVTASSSEDESNTDYEREELPRIIPKQIAAPSSIDILCNAAASAISAQKDLKGYPDHLEVLKETRTYVFFGPSRKDNYQKYFKAVYSRERNFRIEEGYKVVLEGHSSDSQQVWNVILIGQATNRHLWVWLHKHDSGDVLMRPISEIVDVVGRATQDEMNIGLQKLREKETSGAHARREKRKDSYDRDFAFPKRFKNKSDPESSQDSPTSSPHHEHHHHHTVPHYPPTIVNGHPIPYGFPGSPGSHPIVNSIAPIEAVNGYKMPQNTSSSNPYLFPYMYMQPPTLSGHSDVTINQNWRKYLRAQLLRMVHELDALDSFEAKKNDH